jgi:hypothetical protein
LVKVVHPKTGKIVRTYCQTNEEQSALPWLHRKEVVSYETVTAKVGTPVSLAPSAMTSTNTLIQPPTTQPPNQLPPAAVKWQSQYGNSTSVESSTHPTVILP